SPHPDKNEPHRTKHQPPPPPAPPRAPAAPRPAPRAPRRGAAAGARPGPPRPPAPRPGRGPPAARAPRAHRRRRGPRAAALRGDTPVAQYLEARRLGIETRPVLIGPVTFLWLSKTVDGSDRFALLDRLVPAYVQLLEKLHAAGAGWVQVDEPALVLDLPEPVRDACRRAYAALAAGPRPKLMLASYFGALGDNLQLAASLPVDGLHLDLVRAPEQLEAALDALPPGRMLSLGLVDGRNVWRTRLDNALLLARYARTRLGADNVCLAPSCSLLHVPVDLDAENGLDPELRSWLSFAKQKLGEIRVLADALD